MKSLRIRVDRILHRTHVRIATDDWQVLADYYLERLKEEDVDPERYRAASEDLTEILLSIDPVQEKEKYERTISEFATKNMAGYFAHIYFWAMRMANSPTSFQWHDQKLAKGFLEHVRQVREARKTKKRSD